MSEIVHQPLLHLRGPPHGVQLPLGPPRAGRHALPLRVQLLPALLGGAQSPGQGLTGPAQLQRLLVQAGGLLLSLLGRGRGGRVLQMLVCALGYRDVEDMFKMVGLFPDQKKTF